MPAGAPAPAEWYRRAWRRAVVDQHITADDPSFLSRFDAGAYVDLLRLSGAQSAVIYAHSHVGLCFYPSTVGHVHPAARERDLFGEVVVRAHAAGIAAVAYLSVIYDTAAYRANPDWRIVDATGKEVAADSRYGVCCPNAPYRDYIRALGAEVAARYPVDGVRFDMTFWPAVCYCAHCRARFRASSGAELPTTVDWHDPRWVAFQRAREVWLCEFAACLTAAVRAVRPQASVEHQSSVYLANWRLGVTCDLAAHSDFLQGDFYGDALQGSIARKLFHNLSPNRPAAFETSVGIDLANYAVLKPEALLRAKAAAALADGCAFVTIDSIDPPGTLNRAVYERVERVTAALRPYHEVVGEDLPSAELVQDVGVYLGTEAKVDFADNGRPIDSPAGWSGGSPHLDALVSVCRALQQDHVPFGVITRRDLQRLDRHRLVVLPNLLAISGEEAQVLREYVHRGGRLYASGWTSLVTSDGVRQADFLLSDVFGVSWAGRTAERYTYMAPAPGSEALFAGYDADHPPALDAPQMVVRALPGAEVLATVTLPYTDPDDARRFASIHNNPPGRPTPHPAVVRHRFGAGEALYLAGDLERMDPHRPIFLALARSLAAPFAAAAAAPAAVEMTVLRQPEGGRALIFLVNFQKDLPNIPVDGIHVRLDLASLGLSAGAGPLHLRRLPENLDWPFASVEGGVSFTAPRLETLLLFALGR